MGRILKGAVYIDRTFTSEKSGFGKNVCMERENLGGSTVVFHPGGRARGRYDNAPGQTLYVG
jgi:hypothetical protein